MADGKINFALSDAELQNGYYTLGIDIVATPTANVDDLELTWTEAGLTCDWEVHRSLTPYFVPSPSTLVTTLPNGTNHYTIAGLIADATENDYLVIHPINCVAPDSQEMGVFHFGIVPGTP